LEDSEIDEFEDCSDNSIDKNTVPRTTSSEVYSKMSSINGDIIENDHVSEGASDYAFLGEQTDSIISLGHDNLQDELPVEDQAIPYTFFHIQYDLETHMNRTYTTNERLGREERVYFEFASGEF